MANEKLKGRKKIKKAAEAKNKVLGRRDKIQKENSIKRKVKKAAHATRERLKPFIKDPQKKEERDKMQKEINLAQLEENMRILEALEQEYLREQEEKAELNEKLEAEGFVEIKDKLSELERQAKIQAQEMGLEIHTGEEPTEQEKEI